MNTREAFGREVLRLRKLRGLTQADLAAQLSDELGDDIPALTVTRIEGGKRATSIEELTGLAVVFGVDPARLIAASPVARAIRNLQWQAVGSQRRVEQHQTAAADELAQMETIAALITALETLNAYLRTGRTAGVCDALAKLAREEVNPAFADAATLQELATELYATLSEAEVARFVEDREGSTIPADAALALLGKIIEERGDAEA